MKFSEISITQEHLQLLDTYQAALPHSQFMQSGKWLEFQTSRGNRVALLADERKENFVVAVRQPLFSNYSYWYLPRVVWQEGIAEAIADLDPKALFVRFDPVNKIQENKFVKTIDVQPSKTLILKLEGPEEKMLNQMHQKTRYNIRLGLKKKLAIKTGKQYAAEFLDLLEETRQRDKFRLHSRAYYERMIESGAAEVVSAWHDNEMLAGSLIVSFGDTVTYVHGASSSRKRELMAPYVLHWHNIKTACDAGFAYYDWQGIDEKKWPGVTRFKLGFGGEEMLYPGTFDKPLAPLQYRVYTIGRIIRRLF